MVNKQISFHIFVQKMVLLIWILHHNQWYDLPSSNSYELFNIIVDKLNIDYFWFSTKKKLTFILYSHSYQLPIFVPDFWFNYSKNEGKKKYFTTYTMRRSQSAQIFWPGGNPLFDGGFGTLIGAKTCLVTGIWCSDVWLYIDDGLATIFFLNMEILF